MKIKIEKIQNYPFDHLDPERVLDELIEIKDKLNEIVDYINTTTLSESPPPPTTEELQAELKASCKKVELQQVMFPSDGERYEELLKELYLRKEKPETWLIPKK